MAGFFGRLSTHRKLLLVANAAIFAVIGGALGVGVNGEAAPVLRAPLAREARQLEADAALNPTPESVALLADTYVHGGQPGLAIAILNRSGTPEAPETALAKSHALYASGKAREALETVEALAARCDERQNADPCPTWIVAKAFHERAFFSEMVSAGIDDPLVDPEATQAAFERSRREVRLVAIR